jgi:hypothetical protein
MINRRDFLKIGGVVLVGSGLVNPAFKVLAEESVAAQGRILTRTVLRSSPQAGAQVTHMMMPDSVQPMLAYQNGWVRLPGGFVAERDIQPMLDANNQPVDELPVWVEVIAPYAALRQWTQSEAPLISRLGHGAVLRAEARLDDAAGRAWLRADGGWLQMVHVQPVQIRDSGSRLSAVIDRAENYLLLEHRGREVARFAIARPESLVPGEYRIETRSPGKLWRLETNGDFSLNGTTNHNHFARITSGENVELSVIAAKTIYPALPEGSKISIR